MRVESSKESIVFVSGHALSPVSGMEFPTFGPLLLTLREIGTFAMPVLDGVSPDRMVRPEHTAKDFGGVNRLGIVGLIAQVTASRTAAGKSGWAAGAMLAALTHFTYVALTAVLILAGLGVPMPEDIPLILSGYMCNEKVSPIKYVMVDSDNDGVKDTQETTNRKVPKVHWMIVAGMVGVLLGDSIVFSIGRRGIESNNFVARHLRKVMHSKRREKVEKHFARHGNLTVFAGRFAPGFRSIVFAFAGLSKMSYARFLLIDGIAAGISVPSSMVPVVSTVTWAITGM